MSTNSDLICDALRELGVISEIQTPSAEQGAHGLRKFNQLMAKWIEDGLDFKSWFPQTTLSDTCPIPDYAEHGVVTNLALAIAPNYGSATAVSELLIAQAQSGYETICRTLVTQNLPVGRMLTRPDGSAGSRSNILTDTP